MYVYIYIRIYTLTYKEFFKNIVNMINTNNKIRGNSLLSVNKQSPLIFLI